MHIVLGKEGVGKGIIMKELELDENEAYQKLRKMSMDRCLNLVEISKKLLRSILRLKSNGYMLRR